MARIKKGSGLIGPLSLTDERWREYTFPDPLKSAYRIKSPVSLWYREGGVTHRILDKKGNVHCVPAPTANNGVVIVWRPRDPANPVQF